MRKRSLLLLMGFAACVGADEFRPLVSGDPAPDYGAHSLAGDTVSIASLAGEVVLVNVWATWCIPCREEMPALQRLHEQRREDGLRIVGVSVDSHGEDQVRGFAEDLGITFTILLDPRGTVKRAFRTTGVPESVLIGRDGRIVTRWFGAFDPFSVEARQVIDEAIAMHRVTSS